MSGVGRLRGLTAAVKGAPGLTALAVVLTLTMAAPVLERPAERLFGREIAGRHHDPFTVIAQFERPPTLGPYTQPATDWIGIAAARLLGDGHRAYHLMVLASFPLAALFAFLFARRLGGSVLGAWTAGLIYAFLPFHWAHAAYHPHNTQTQWLPLYFLSLWLCAERFTVRRATLLTVAAILVGLCNFYFGLIAAVLTPVALAVLWRQAVVERRPRAHRAPAATAALLLALGAAAIAAVASWAPRVLTERAAFAFAAGDVERYTARWWSYLVPPIDHPLGGAVLAGFWARQDPGGLVERQLAVGLGVLTLAAVALFAWRRGDRPELTRSVPFLMGVAATAFIFSLPPVWRLGALTLPTPSGLLHRLAPMFRAHARFGLAVGLTAAVLAGIGFAWLWARPRRGRPAAVALALLLLLELAPFPPWRWRDVLPTTAHRWLASRDDVKAVMDCVRGPTAAATSADRFFPHRLARPLPQTGCGDPQTPDLLAARGFSHLLVRQSSPLGAWLGERSPPAGLDRVGTFDDALLYRVTARAPVLAARFRSGFHHREYQELGSYRWMTRSGSLELTVAVPHPVSAALDLELHAFPAPREIDTRLDDAPLATLTVPTEPTVLRLELGELAAGRHLLELTSRTPAAVPAEILSNGDHRRVSIALWSWVWIEAGG